MTDPTNAALAVEQCDQETAKSAGGALVDEFMLIEAQRPQIIAVLEPHFARHRLSALRQQPEQAREGVDEDLSWMDDLDMKMPELEQLCQERGLTLKDIDGWEAAGFYAERYKQEHETLERLKNRGVEIIRENQQLKSALSAQPATQAPEAGAERVEPVAWMYERGDQKRADCYRWNAHHREVGWTETPLYAHPTAAPERPCHLPGCSIMQSHTHDPSDRSQITVPNLPTSSEPAAVAQPAPGVGEIEPRTLRRLEALATAKLPDSLHSVMLSPEEAKAILAALQPKGEG